jgi:hypothetical protein
MQAVEQALVQAVEQALVQAVEQALVRAVEQALLPAREHTCPWTLDGSSENLKVIGFPILAPTSTVLPTST